MEDVEVVYAVRTSKGELIHLRLCNPEFEFDEAPCDAYRSRHLRVYSTRNDFKYLVAAFPESEWYSIRKVDESEIVRREKQSQM